MSGNPPAGYYADPSIPGYIRYWDGNEWVAGTSRPAPEEVADQVLSSSQGGAAQGGAAQGGGAGAAQDALAASSSAAQSAADVWTPEPQAQLIQPQAGQQYPQQVQQDQAPAVQPQVSQQYTSNPPVVPQQYQSNPPVVPQQYASNPPVAPQQYRSNPAVVPQQYQSNPPVAPQQYPSNPQVAPQQYPSNPQVAPQQHPSDPPAAPATVAAMVVPSAFAARNATGTYAYGSPGNPFAGLPGSAASTEADEETPASVLELATPGSRLLARIIDLGIAAVFSSPITVTLLLIAHRHDHQYVLGLEAQATTTYTTLGMDATGIALWAAAAFALVLVAVVYEGLRLGRGGQTVGKRLAGVRVVHLPDANALRGSGLGMRRALVLWLLAILPVIDLLALGGVLWGRPYRQGLHERVTATATVRA